MKTACFEVARLLSRVSFAGGGPVVIVDSATRAKNPPFGGDSVAARIITVPRRVGRGDRPLGRWRFWQLEYGRAAEFECAWGKGGLELKQTNSLGGAGLMPMRH